MVQRLCLTVALLIRNVDVCILMFDYKSTVDILRFFEDKMGKYLYILKQFKLGTI